MEKSNLNVITIKIIENTQKMCNLQTNFSLALLSTSVVPQALRRLTTPHHPVKYHFRSSLF
jgi:hypothetical protein